MRALDEVSPRALECAEELRVNTLLDRLGFDLSLLCDGTEKLGARRLGRARARGAKRCASCWRCSAPAPSESSSPACAGSTPRGWRALRAVRKRAAGDPRRRARARSADTAERRGPAARLRHLDAARSRGCLTSPRRRARATRRRRAAGLSPLARSRAAGGRRRAFRAARHRRVRFERRPATHVADAPNARRRRRDRRCAIPGGCSPTITVAPSSARRAAWRRRRR